MTAEGSVKLWNWAFSKLPLAIDSFRCIAVLIIVKIECLL
jgi:hypothetical protein